MTDKTQSILVWDWPTRVFHWSLALSFIVAYLTAESGRYTHVHFASGYLFGGLILFRLIWGLIGSRYARFSSFSTGPKAVKRYLGSLWSRQAEHHIGHNPAGSVAIFALLGLGLAVAFSGYGLDFEIGGEWVEIVLEEMHEIGGNLMLLVVIVHVAGVFVSSFLHRENLVRSMLHGRKQGPLQQQAEASYPVVGGIVLVLAGAFLAYYLL